MLTWDYESLFLPKSMFSGVKGSKKDTFKYAVEFYMCNSILTSRSPVFFCNLPTLPHKAQVLSSVLGTQLLLTKQAWSKLTPYGFFSYLTTPMKFPCVTAP